MKNRTTKIALILLALVLATSFVVGTTLAKYTTKIQGADTARVAKFGVELAITTDTFDATYEGNDGISVKNLSTDGKNLVAPGTAKEDAITFTIAGAPEVDVNVVVTLDNNDALSMVTLPAGTYDDYTDYNKLNADVTYTSPEYNPVVWTLEFTPEGSSDPAQVLETGNLQAIENYLATNICGNYDVNNATQFAALIGTYTISWTWTFETELPAESDPTYAAALEAATLKDQQDTTLGQIEAGVVTGVAGYVANETFDLFIKVTQLD